jgi:FkbM family methyltransferase
LNRLFKILHFIDQHPLAKKNRWKAYARFFIWQFKQSIRPGARICRFVEDSVLLIDKGMIGATGNIYVGLLEFEDMAFVLHFLRPGDVMGDIGANVGVYTILAAKNAGAKVIAIEPIPAAFHHLKDNVKLNNIDQLVTILNCGAADENGELEFTTTMDAVNHVAVAEDKIESTKLIKVSVRTTDDIFQNNQPVLLKIDVEGFELPVIKGAKNILKSDQLSAIIIELNGSGMRYGFRDDEIHNELLSYGFSSYCYEPFTREIKSIDKPGNLNTIYLRNENWVLERLTSSRKFNVIGQLI